MAGYLSNGPNLEWLSHKNCTTEYKQEGERKWRGDYEQALSFNLIKYYCYLLYQLVFLSHAFSDCSEDHLCDPPSTTIRFLLPARREIIT